MRDYYCITQLTGRGYETLLDGVDGTVLACFVNGNLVCSSVAPSTEGQQAIETAIAA